MKKLILCHNCDTYININRSGSDIKTLFCPECDCLGFDDQKKIIKDFVLQRYNFGYSIKSTIYVSKNIKSISFERLQRKITKNPENYLLMECKSYVISLYKNDFNSEEIEEIKFNMDYLSWKSFNLDNWISGEKLMQIKKAQNEVNN